RLLTLVRHVRCDSRVMLLQRGGKHMAAVVLGRGDEVNRVGFLGTCGRSNRGGAGQGDGGGRQPDAGVGVVGPIGAQVRGANVAVVAVAESVDHRWIGLQ